MGITNESKINQYREIHANQEYGVSSYAMAKDIIPCIIELEAKSILDYGCGQSRLYERLKVNHSTKVYRYDPAILEISVIPVSHVDLIVNTDVLEHIPEEDLDEILAHMKSLGENCFFNIHTGLAKQILPSGENAHCTIHPPEWWKDKIALFFPEARIDYIHKRGCIIKTWPKTNEHFLKRIFERKKWLKRFKQYKNSIKKRM